MKVRCPGLASDGGAGPLGRGLEPPCTRGTSSLGKPYLCSQGFQLNKPGLHRQSRTVSLLKVTRSQTAVPSVQHTVPAAQRSVWVTGRVLCSRAGGLEGGQAFQAGCA